MNEIKVINPSIIEVDDYHEFAIIVEYLKQLTFDDTIDYEESYFDEDVTKYVGIIYNSESVKEKDELAEIIKESIENSSEEIRSRPVAKEV